MNTSDSSQSGSNPPPVSESTESQAIASQSAASQSAAQNIDSSATARPRKQGSPSAVPHRRRVTDWILRSAGSPGSRVLVIGPGVAVHLEIERLLERSIELHVADFDEQLLLESLGRQNITYDPNRHHFFEDPAGIKSHIEQLKLISAERTPGFHDVQAAIDAAANFHGWPIDGPFDVVLSAEALGTLGGICQQAVGPSHPSISEWLRAIRVRHLQEMIALLRPDGLGVVINAIISSNQMPSLPKVPDETFEAVLSEVLERHHVAPHADPRVPMHALEFEAAIRDYIAAVRLLSPWRAVNRESQYAFSGLSFRTQIPPEPTAEDETDAEADGNA